MKVVYALSLLALACAADKRRNEFRWNEFRKKYERKYETQAEEKKRLKVFYHNMEKVSYWNRNIAEGDFGSLTPVADYYPEELFSVVKVPEKIETEPEPTDEQIEAIPDAYDARDDKLLPKIRKQGKCRSSWAFATIASIEINYAKKHGVPSPVLSEQQLIDCAPNTDGCTGGWPADALEYAKGGLVAKGDYKYETKKGKCRAAGLETKVKVEKFGYVSPTVSGIKDAIIRYGSVIAPINAMKMQFYQDGVMLRSSCEETPNHFVNIVGWGRTETNGYDYWIVRNSWGQSWGIDGYIKVFMSKNACGIESYPMYVSVE